MTAINAKSNETFIYSNDICLIIPIRQIAPKQEKNNKRQKQNKEVAWFSITGYEDTEQKSHYKLDFSGKLKQLLCYRSFKLKKKIELME